MTRRDWFSFVDRETSKYHPIGAGTMITTHRFYSESYRSTEAEDWEKEQWEISAALTPIGQLENAVTSIAQTGVSKLSFSPYWKDAETFDFAESMRLAQVELLPGVFLRKHPLTGRLMIEPRQDFTLYHTLDAQTGGKYIHPLDDMVVLKVSTEQYEFYKPQPHVSVYSDYLRDYLAARKMGLLISVVADRFAKARSDSELELEKVDLKQVGENAWIRTTIHPAGTIYEQAMGRSSLYWLVVIKPYDHPKPIRSAWPYYEKPDTSATPVDQNLPRFIADAEGNTVTLSDPQCPLYLYFKPHVLEKYLETRGYKVFFHMRTWGGACGPQVENCVDVGINSEGLVTAYAPDIAKLKRQEQLHWAHYSSLPNGGVCQELWQTRMQLNPPHSPSVIELITKSRRNLADAYRQRFSQELYSDFEPQQADLRRMSVGPVRGDVREVVDLAKPLYTWTVESLQVSALRTPLATNGIEFDKQAKQIVLLRTLLKEIVGLPENDAVSLVDPLRGLNDLRVIAAHSLNHDFDDAFRKLGVESVPESPRDAWDRLVDRIAGALDSISAALG